MASLNLEHLETKCPVCHELYLEPKILPCAHLLCRNCLVSCIKTMTTALCPLCRTAIHDCNDINSRSSEDLADSLLTDQAMSAVIECCKILSHRRVCCVHTDADALALCLQCGVMLCQACAEYHHAFPLTSSHECENLATLTPGRLAACRQTPCSTHASETSKLFCLTHNVAICHICASSKHRACQEVTDLIDLVDKHKNMMLEMEAKLMNTEIKLNECMAKLDEYVLMSKENTTSSLSKIDIMCDDLIKSVESCRQQLKKTLHDGDDNVNTAVQERKSLLKQKYGWVSSHRQLIKRIAQTAPASMQTTMATMIEDRIKDFNSLELFPAHRVPIRTALLTIDAKVLSSIKTEVEKMTEMVTMLALEEENCWAFHTNHGSNIMLTNNRQTAVVMDNTISCNRIIISEVPMAQNKLYEVKVEETDTSRGGQYIIIGICQENPATFLLPSESYNLHSVVGVHSTGGTRNCKWNNDSSSPALNTVAVGSRLGVMVDARNCLHLFVDSKDQGVVARNVGQQYFAMIDLRYFLKKVTTLPMSNVQ